MGPKPSSKRRGASMPSSTGPNSTGPNSTGPNSPRRPKQLLAHKPLEYPLMSKKSPAAKPPTATPRPRSSPRSKTEAIQSTTTRSAAAPLSASAPEADAQRAVAPQGKRFDIFIVDVGWHSPVADVLRKNLE